MPGMANQQTQQQDQEQAAPEQTPIERAIELAGGTEALMDKMNRAAGYIIVESPNVICNWRTRKRVPPEFCGAIELALRGKIKRRDLNANLWSKRPSLPPPKPPKQPNGVEA